MMFRKLAVVAVGAAFMASAPASAADYLFNLTGSYTASFTLTSLPKPSYVLNNAAFVLYDVPGTFPGDTSPVADLTFYNSRQGGGFKIHDFAADVDLLTTHGAQLYTGSEAAPAFRLGTFQLSPSAGLDRYTLTISSLASAAPEPGAWAMMIVGFGAAGGVLRRRRKVSVHVTYAG